MYQTWWNGNPGVVVRWRWFWQALTLTRLQLRDLLVSGCAVLRRLGGLFGMTLHLHYSLTIDTVYHYIRFTYNNHSDDWWFKIKLKSISINDINWWLWITTWYQMDRETPCRCVFQWIDDIIFWSMNIQYSIEIKWCQMMIRCSSMDYNDAFELDGAVFIMHRWQRQALYSIIERSCIRW